jgi:hypothetical protein
MTQVVHDMPPLESERPRVVAASRIQTPALVVLLGSTSALAGLELMRHMLTLKGEDRRQVALVYIDTDDPPAPLVEFRQQYTNVFQEFPLRISIPVGILEAQHIDESARHTFIEGRAPQYFTNGAGGIRNNGHVAACFNYQYIYDVLDRALASVARLGNEQGTAQVRAVQANIVSFLGGGTGSGILADIAVIVRELLMYRQYDQRLNLFCMLPEPVSGVNPNDVRWRKSNATACLLELIAFSRAAAGSPSGIYEKRMRDRAHRLTNDPLANEVYLIGRSAMDNAGDTARIVGQDLFQRIADASGVGFLEHSKWVDRRTLGATDERGLPTMFGTSCPLEVRFPAEEMALAYAQISASYLLPLLASYRPAAVAATEVEQREWQKKWRQVARFDAGASNPQAIRINEFRRSDFEDAVETQLDLLWARLERTEREAEARIKDSIEQHERSELARMKAVPRQGAESGEAVSLINFRILQLQRLQQEYGCALDELRTRQAPQVPLRPHDLETKLVRQPQLPGLLHRLMRDHAGAVCEEYNAHMHAYARAARHRLLEQTLKNLLQHIQENLAQSIAWFQNAGAEDRARGLKERGLGSMAWHGTLEHPHPHQRHIFDLRTLRTQDGRNIAAERLYLWATGGDPAVRGEPLEYRNFVGPCVEYMSRQISSGSGQAASIERQVARRLADQVVEFFQDYYLQCFQNMNLFELLYKATPPPRSDQPREEQIGNYLLEHLQHMRGLMTSLVAFEAQLWVEGLNTLDTSVYMGVHFRDGSQQAQLDQVLRKLGPLTSGGQTSVVAISLDPHRLQVAYGQHAISLSTVRDFYLDQNSSMACYLEYQGIWSTSGGKGLMPVHSSQEAQRLVIDNDALGYQRSLPDLVIRRPAAVSTPAQTPAPGSGSGSVTPPWPQDIL